MPSASATFSNVALGCALPPYAPHAISVSLPTWRDNVDYEEGDKRVLDKMVSGYPRFFIPLPVQKVCFLLSPNASLPSPPQLTTHNSQLTTTHVCYQLSSICEQKYAIHNEKCLLLPSRKAAEHCRSFIELRTEQVLGRRYTARCVEERHGDPSVHGGQSGGGGVNGGEKQVEVGGAGAGAGAEAGIMALYMVLFDAAAYGVAREFWQHTGLGVSSRFAERFLSLLELSSSPPLPPLPSSSSSSPSSALPVAALEGVGGAGVGGGKMHNRHYSVNKDRAWTRHYQGTSSPADNELGADGRTYLEERYGRNMPLGVAAFAKRALRRRLAGVWIKDVDGDGDGGDLELDLRACAAGGASSRGVKSVAEGDVYLTPSGMTAIWTAHQCLLGVGPEAKSVCFGCALFSLF